MANRYWTGNSQRSVSASGHGPAYGRDGGKVLNDTETQPKYNENIGPDGPDLNRVNFATVKAHVKARFMIMEGGSPLIGPVMESGHFLSGTGEQGGGLDLANVGKAISEGSKGLGQMDQPSAGSSLDSRGSGGGSERVQTEFSKHVQRRGER